MLKKLLDSNLLSLKEFFGEGVGNKATHLEGFQRFEI